MTKLFNGLYAFGIAANTSLIAINLLEFGKEGAAFFNFICAILCWIGYYRTKENGDERRH